MIDFSTPKPLIFISGKGGTGKTIFSLLVANELSSQLGLRVLYVSLADAGFLNYILSQEVTYEPTRAKAFRFDICKLTGLECLKEYLAFKSNLGRVTDNIFKSNFLKYLLPQAPGLSEISILGKLTSKIRQHGPSLDYDTIVIDGYSTGHFISLLKVPVALAESSRLGPMHRESNSIFEVLKDKLSTQFILISTFEDYSCQELLEGFSGIKKILNQESLVLGNKKNLWPDELKSYKIEKIKKSEDIIKQKLKNAVNLKYYLPQYFETPDKIITKRLTECLRVE